jgi:hypothetical protein
VPDAGPDNVVLVEFMETSISGVCVKRPDGNVTDIDELAATLTVPVLTEKKIGRAVPVALFTIWLG